ncbi:pro-resilin-like [Penaeus japonicus]|uniref:pro-resilin-like n=1 Tax=Penaeus japonicus TaxID=27405 RepID=UPI001C712FAE|nr:pro-resilin-like [Penaeus japonicus]
MVFRDETALLALALVLASSSPSSAAKLTVTEPPGYVIRTPAIPFTAEEDQASVGRGFQQAPSANFGFQQAPSIPSSVPAAAAPRPAAAAPSPATAFRPSAAAPAPLYQGPAAGSAGVRGQQALQGAASQGPQVPAQYDFGYAVSADDAVGNRLDYGHQEERNGAQTAGSYFVRLPDTRVMRVEYTVDEFGFHPIVTFEGEAVYPDVASPVGSPVGSPSARRPDQLYAAPSRK